MNPVKRQLDNNQFFNDETKKLRQITSIENFSNEVFYEIFDYLDGCDICKAFENLNTRFQHLVMYSLFPFKIKLHSNSESEVEHCCKKVLIPNKHHIISLNLKNELLINDVFNFCIIDSSFNRLESIILHDISYCELMKLFFYLKSLPCLISLTMNLNAEKNHAFGDIYQSIFSLPHLKYNQLRTFSYERLNLFVPPVNNEQYSTIKYLVINHDCTLDELTSMLLYTPRLRHLICHNLLQSNYNFNNKQPLILPDLTHIRINASHVNFNIFEMFITKISSSLQVLSISRCRTEDYLDVDRWEKLIVGHIPLLHTFHFEYLKKFDRVIHLNTKLNWFTSQFWAERQWFPKFVVYKKGVSYSIHSHRNTWKYIYKHKEIASYFDENFNQNSSQYISIDNRQHTTDISSAQFIPTSQLTVANNPIDTRQQTFIGDFESIFLLIPFTRLNINCKEIPIKILVKIIQSLPNLNSIKVLSLPFIKSDQLFYEDKDLHSLSSNKNKITKVILKKMANIEQVYILFKLCPNMQYFHVNVPQYMDLEICVRFILKKINTCVPQLNSLRLYIPNANECMVYKLHKMISSEKLLANYMIKRMGNNILLKWN